MTLLNRKVIVSIVGVLLVLLSAQIAFAYTTPHCITLGDFEVCFLDVTSNDDGTYSWYYSIEGTGGIDGVVDQELSHWTLELCTGYTVEEPDGTFPTLAEYNGVTSNEPGSSYLVEVGKDPSTSTDISGIKFESEPGSEQIGDGDLHIFAFTTSSAETRIGDTQVLVKWGSGDQVGTITGPVCAPTAVTMTALSAASETSFDYSAAALVGLIALVPAAIVIRRRIS